MNLEEIGKKVKKFSKETVAEVQKMNEVRQLNSRVSDEKRLLANLFQEMGQKLYDTYKEAPLEGFEEELRKVQEHYSTIDLLQDQIRAVKGVVLCPCCNMEVGADERFCSNCGNRMPDVVTIEDKSDEDAIIVDSQVVEPKAEDGETAEETGEAAEAVAEEVGDAAETAEEEVGEAAETVVAEVGDAAETAEEEAGEAAETVAAEAGEAAETVAAEAGEAVETVAEKAGEAAETVAEEAGEAAETVEDVAETVAAEAGEAAETVEEKSGDAVVKAEDAAKTAAEEV